MNTINFFILLLSVIASVITILLFLKTFLYKKPYHDGYKSGYRAGLEKGLKEGFCLGIDRTKKLGRRLGAARNLDHLINDNRILNMIEKRDRISTIYTNNVEFQAETSNFIISLYTGLRERYEEHLEEIEKKINISKNKNKKLLLILVLIGANNDVINRRLKTFDELKKNFEKNEHIEFDQYIDLEYSYTVDNLEDDIEKLIPEQVNKYMEELKIERPLD